MEKRKALGAILILMMTALSGFSKAGAMELSPEEIESQEIASSFLQGSSNASILLRSMIAYQGELIELPGHESSIKMEGLYPQAWCVVIPWNAEILGNKCFMGRKSLMCVAFEAESALTHVEEYAFASSDLWFIGIPAKVQELGEGCFSGCESLACVAFEFGSQLVIIGAHALIRANLSLIILPKSVAMLEEYCFTWCGSLSLVIFEEHSQLVRVGGGAFSGTDLHSIALPGEEGNPLCGTSFGPCIFEDSPITEIFVGGVLVDSCLGLHAGTGIPRIVEIPQDVERLPPFCYARCPSLIEVTFPSDSHLKEIGPSAFYGASLRFFACPRSVQMIGERCFSFCTSLFSFSFEVGSQLERIGKDTFAHSSLDTICIPASVQELGECCFAGCPSLISVVCEAGSQLERVEVRAFRACSVLQTVTLPASVTMLGEHCFAFCPALISVMCEAGSQPAEIGEGVFEGSPQAQFVFPHAGERDEASSQD